MEYLIESPTQTQLQRLRELILQHRTILVSNADDGPLKERIWSIITEELNSMDDGPLLEPKEWKSYINLDEFRNKRGRKAFNDCNGKIVNDYIKKNPDEHTKRMKMDMSASTTTKNDYLHEDSETVTEISIEEDISNDELETNNGDADDEDYDLETLLNSIESDENDEQFSESNNTNNVINMKTNKPTPLVKTFKFSKRMLETVEHINVEVNNIKEQIKQTSQTLSNIEKILQKQLQQQAETNALIKRNCQLTKILVEYKIGRRTKIVNELN